MVAKRRIAIALFGGFVAETINRIFPIFIIHYVASRIGVEGFGFAQMGIQIIDLAVFFIIFGFHTNGAVEVGNLKEDRKAAARKISEICSLKLMNAIIAFAGISAIVMFVPTYQPYQDIVWALSFMLFTTAIDMSFVHLGTQKMLSLSVLTVLAKMLSLGLIVSFIDDPDDAVLYAVLSFGANALVSFGTVWISLRQFPLAAPSWAAMKQQFFTASPFAVTMMLLILLDRFDLFVVQHHEGAKGAGMYAAASRIILSIVNVLSAIGNIFFSEMVAAKNRDSLSKHVQLSMKALLVIVIPMTFGAFIVGGDLLAAIVGEDFRGSGSLVSYLMLACLMHVFIVVYGLQVLQVKKLSKPLNIVLFLSIVSGLVMANIFYGPYGRDGVAFALILAKFGAGLAVMVIASKTVRLVGFGTIVRILIPGGLMFGGLVALGFDALVLNLLVGALVYLSTLIAFNWSDARSFGTLVLSRIGQNR